MSYPFVGVVATPAIGGPAQPHPAYAFQYRFPQFNVSSQVPQNIPRVTATGVGPQGETADWRGAPSYPLAQIGKLRGLRGLRGLGAFDPGSSFATTKDALLAAASAAGFDNVATYLADPDSIPAGTITVNRNADGSVTIAGSGRTFDLAGDYARGVIAAVEAMQGASSWYANPNVQLALGALSLVGTGLCAYHGYKRNNSVGWAIVWGLLGSLFPIITVPVAFAQGLGKRKGR